LEGSVPAPPKKFWLNNRCHLSHAPCPSMAKASDMVG
jgi:hypothetical protein